MKNTIAIIFFLSLLSCATFKPYNKQGGGEQSELNSSLTLERSIFAVSGLSSKAKHSSGVLGVLKQQLDRVGDKSTLLVLGNFGLKTGLPDSSHLNRKQQYVQSLSSAIDLISNFNGNPYFIPGLNEWSNGRKKGLASVQRLQAYLEGMSGKEEALYPGDGCPGPFEVELYDNTVLLIIDTQWWFQTGTNEEESTCEIKGKGHFIVALNDAIKRNYNKHVIVAGFHPLFSNGPSAGYFPAKKHFLPPVIGSLHALYKRRIGDPQDISNFNYKTFRTILTSSFRNHPNLVYLSAKERSMQYFKQNGVHLIVSGSMSGATATSSKEGPEFAFGQPGFTRINQYTNGEVWLEFWGADNQGKEQMVYRNRLYQWTPVKEEEIISSDLDFAGQTIEAFATKKHHKKKNKKGFMGLNYRKEWEAAISGVPVFDIGKEKGGLKIIKRGGGLQTISLRLEDKTGKQWVLRSVEKYPSKALPVELRGTYIEDYVTDQTSASHPYGALVVPPMADAVNVYHTNPKLVYLPDDPRFGIYKQDFANGLYIFEERPDDEAWEDAEFFGKPDDIVSTSKLIKKMVDSGDDFPDQAQTVRSRLFDIVIGDWDRHDDQWRWAKFKKAKKYGEKIDSYQPIPRDRDQAFFFGDGALIELGSHKWGQPKFQGFKHKIRDVEGLTFNARYFDRYFITEADWLVWQEQAKYIQDHLTDEVIESAIKTWPEEIYSLNGEVIIAKLKQRRDDLMEYAGRVYRFLSKNVNVLGSGKADRFVVERLEGGQTKVTVYRVKKDKRDIKGKYYERIFEPAVTREIRLYGLGGKDKFELTGKVDNGITIRIIGGEGKDVIDDQSEVKGMGKKTIFYDNVTGTEINRSKETRLKTSDDNELINNYNRKEFKYDVLAPMFFGGFNPDDLILIGGGVSFTKHGFRKNPFKTRHTFLFDVATKSNSFNFKVINEFSQVLGKWDIVNTLDVSEPAFADFFYGYGNGTTVDESQKEDDSQFYRARYSQIKVAPVLRRRWNDDKHTIEIGGFYQRINVETEDNDSKGLNRFIFDYDSLRQTQGFALLDRDRSFGGGTFKYAFDNTNSVMVPTSGFRYDLSARIMAQISDEEELNNSQFTSNLSFYFTVGKSDRVTFASRIGGIVTTGDFEFYHAARLGGLKNLRGHRRFRFGGKNAIYQNNDIRIKLFDMKNKVFVGPFGVNFIADFGRVWAGDLPDKTGKDEWHKSVGGGIWVAPFKTFVLAFDYTKSLSLTDEDGVPFVRFGFFF